MAQFDDNTFIQVRISEKTPFGMFNDSLYYKVADFEKLSEKEVEAAVALRVSNWVAFVETESAKGKPELTDAELAVQKAAYIKEKEVIDAKIAEIDVELSK